ncbi:septal ring lytic transglycosylase RlpA family protein [Oricola thermophila]|uniref:Endolytic peptidoglycan transglycosylase RlpA n=1 Tax=Oricola thermophila TaxID=2742145 RepID=A0A6N1VK07_9HYPH|nr:septal ring lytic transglycosylase RlpA family protein [Oricola thermophila]
MKTAFTGTAFLAAAAAALCACSTLPARAQCGKASWYALHSQTASGEMMDPSEMTAAHRKLPFGTRVRVTNERNGKSVIVRINDRGPFVRGRIIDLSKAAASRIGMVRSGHAPVCIAETGK